MNVKFGKREQIVVIALSGIITVLLLHVFLFKEHAANYRDARASRTEKEAGIKNLAKIGDQRAFARFRETTRTIDIAYNDAITSFGVSKPSAFEIPGSPAEIVLDPPPAKNLPPEQVAKLRQAEFQKVLDQKLPEQVNLIYEEIDRLRSHDPRLPANQANETKMLFLSEPIGGGGWSFPTRLNPAIYSGADSDVGRIKDTLGEIHQTKGIIKNLLPELRAQRKNYYEEQLANLGIDNSVYRDIATPNNLASMGPHVPLIHKLVFAMLIEDALQRGQVDTISNEPVNRLAIFNWLEIKLPHETMSPLNVNELYFIHQELRYLNRILEIAEETGVSEVLGVQFEPPAYISEQVSPADPNKDAVVTPPPPPSTPLWVLEDAPAVEGAVAPPGPRDIGFCIPVIIQFHATNLNTWRFLYALNREYVLCELDEAIFLSASEAGDINCQVKFLFTPYIFAADRTLAPPKPPPPPPPRRGSPPPVPAGAGL